MTTFSPLRAGVILLLLAALLIGMTARVAYLQTYGRQHTIRSAERQQHRTEVLRARRGTIFDRNGLVMAGTIQTRSLYLDPKFVYDWYQSDGRTLNDMDEAMRKLGRLLNRDGDELVVLLGSHYESRYVKVAENVDDNVWDAIQKLDLPGIGTEPVNVRFYPMGSLAAHILGSVGKDDTGRAELGLEGAEMKFNKVLAGVDGWRRVMKDARRRVIGVSADDYVAPIHGQHIVLTIDSNIQMIAEQELAAACEKNKPKRGGEVIVMDPRTGEVLALANWPTFDPQNTEDCPAADSPQYHDYLERRRNRAITDPYECGSTIKPFIAGPAMAWGITTPAEMWPIPGITWVTSYGRHITDVHGYPKLATWDVLVKSSNIGMAMMGQRMGNERLYKALKSFYFGQQTGIELPGEDPGLVNPLAKWTQFTTHSVPQGYELMVTPLQLTRSFCAYANGGHLVQPRVIKGMIDGDGNTVSSRPVIPLPDMPYAIDPATAAQMRRILADVPVRGTARGARSEYWNIFGKTGTSHISEGLAGYSAHRYNSSYLCGAPYENPRLVVTVVLHEPTGDQHYGGAVSAPVGLKIIERSLAYLQVPCSPELPVPPANIAANLYGFDPAAYHFHRGTASTGD